MKMLDELYVMEKDNKLFIGVNYIVGGREAESEYCLEDENVEKFTKPVQIIHGECDKSVPIIYSEKYLSLYKNVSRRKNIFSQRIN